MRLSTVRTGNDVSDDKDARIGQRKRAGRITKNPPGFRGTTSDRFMCKISPEPNSGCWLWTGAVDRNGYGQLRGEQSGPERKGRLLYAHRLAYEMFVGPTRDSWVLHRCHNGRGGCANPAHLYLGTAQQNSRDMMRAGRGSGQLTSERVRGTNCANSKLTERDVLAIRKLKDDGDMWWEICAELKLPKEAVREVYYGRSWRWLHAS